MKIYTYIYLYASETYKKKIFKYIIKFEFKKYKI